MQPQKFLASMQGSQVVRREQERILESTEQGAGVPKEEYEEGMQVGTLVQNELKHVSLMA